MLKVHKNGLFNTGLKNSRNNHEIFELHKYRYKKLGGIIFRCLNFKLGDLCFINKDNSDAIVFYNTIINNNHLFKIEHIANVDDLTYFDNEEEY